jgi:hypothetical protein
VQDLLHVEVSRKNCEKTDAPNSSALTFEAVSVRSRKIRSGSSGAGERTSITTKATTSAAEAASSPIVSVVAHRAGWRGECVDEQHQAAGDRRRAGGVEVPVVELGTALAAARG